MSARSALLGLAWLAAAGAAGAPARGSELDHMPRTAVALPITAQRAQSGGVYNLKVTNNNLIGVTITNYGFTGNNFVSLDSPSCEYPLGTRFEHMVRGGLWVGGIAIDTAGRFVGVTTAAVDGAVGEIISGATEYTPEDREVGVRSTLINDAHYSPNAVSEQDFVSSYDDLTPVKAANTTEPSRPMGIQVRQENYVWSFSDLKHFVIFHYRIKNIGTSPIDSLYAGFYTELASGRGPYHSPWFSKKWISWDASDSMFREHYCNTQPIPTGCNYDYVPPWMGVKILGMRDVRDTTNTRLRPDQIISVGSWTYAPGDPSRAFDVQRYAIMNSGARPDTTDPNLMPGTGDPAEMIAVGPFKELDPGDSVSFDFALVGGDDIAQVRRHGAVAQRAFDSDYVVPVPPPSPRLKVVARDHALDLYWDDSPESATDPTSPNPHDFEGYRVYVGTNQLAPTRVAEFDLPNDTTGFNTGFAAIRLNPPVTDNGVTYTYKYSVTGLRDGFKYYAAVTSFDTGNPVIESLESGFAQNLILAIPGPTEGEVQASGLGITVFPNPYRVDARWDAGQLARDHYLWFTNLPSRCTLRIFTLSGDLVFETDFDGATYHGEGARGVYFPKRDIGVDPPTLAGTTYAWDMVSRQGQAVATGLYLYSVEDRATGKRTVGKFLVVKSDREQF